jgi:hypothetical protein
MRSRHFRDDPAVGRTEPQRPRQLLSRLRTKALPSRAWMGLLTCVAAGLVFIWPVGLVLVGPVGFGVLSAA